MSAGRKPPKREPRRQKLITFQATPEIFALLKTVEKGKRSAIINAAFAIGVKHMESQQPNAQILKNLRQEILKASQSSGLTEAQLLAALEARDILEGLGHGRFSSEGSEGHKGE